MVDTPQCIANKMKSKGLPRFKPTSNLKFSASSALSGSTTGNKLNVETSLRTPRVRIKCHAQSSSRLLQSLFVGEHAGHIKNFNRVSSLSGFSSVTPLPPHVLPSNYGAIALTQVYLEYISYKNQYIAETLRPSSQIHMYYRVAQKTPSALPLTIQI
jgi:hypothetical protein